MRRIAFWAGAVLVALAAVAFAAAADRATMLPFWLAGRAPYAMLAIAPIGLVISALLTRHIFPGAQGSGITQVIAALHLRDSSQISRVLSLRIAAGKVLLTVLGLASGAAIGREGPTVQVGAAIMHALGEALRLPRPETRRALVLAGGAAGISAAVNTPLAGIVFAIEELSHSFEARTSGTVFGAVIMSGIATLALSGNYTYFGVAGGQFAVGVGWVAVVVCGIAGGLLGGLFSRILLSFAALPTAIGRWRGPIGRQLAAHPILFAAVCGLGLAIIGLLSHGATYGTGYQQARSLIEAHAQLPSSFVLLKFAATILSYISGIPGGIFAPSLSVGAGLGDVLSNLLPYAPARSVVLLGMVAYFAGVVQAPLTATVIVMEMTDNQQLTIALLATSMLAYGTSRLICRRSLYGALAVRFLHGMKSETTGSTDPEPHA
jgi:H+/Cl- antiporter ClcA